MDCKDLMIGDLVQFDEDTCVVEELRVDGTAVVTSLNTDLTSIDGDQVDVEEIYPIPLTEEILVKNGFEKAYTKVHGIMVDENLWFGHIGADYVELRLEGNVAIWKDYDEKADGLYSNYLFPLPTSVHQLQHLMRLCGIEKELVID